MLRTNVRKFLFSGFCSQLRNMGKKQRGRGGRSSEPEIQEESLVLDEQKLEQLRSEGTLVIDGSVGEGGGQILRISFALASILQKCDQFHVQNLSVVYSFTY